ncbi:hypothetical protein RJ639_010296 [Escallonia herrerae]|uniref:C2 domain-containing protein n=1 Tax=Escallonia herrerae TaxID=1293975 RepID=A0AA88VSJ9_9ASTE|nr:hypothetical protein RJ639_010296 [Escallonia herrerae]
MESGNTSEEMESKKFIQCRNFHITLISASDLEDVRDLFEMKVYASVSFNEEPRTEKKTPKDKQGKTNPAWNHRMVYTIAEAGILQYGIMLVIKLYCKREFLPDKYIGQVQKPIKELFETALPMGGSAETTMALGKGSGVSQGELRFSYTFGEKIIVKKPSKWKTWVDTGANLLIDFTLASTGLGIMPIEVSIFDQTDVIA